MQEHHRPTHVSVVGQYSFNPVGLLRGDRVRRRLLGIEADEQHVAVDKVVVGAVEALLPDLSHHRVADIVVPRQVEEGHIEFVHEADELVPFAVEDISVFGVPLDQIAHGHDELRLQQVDLAHGVWEDAGTVSSGAIGDDGELEILRVVYQIQMSPRVESLHLDAWTTAVLLRLDDCGQTEGHDGDISKHAQGPFREVCAFRIDQGSNVNNSLLAADRGS